MDKIVGIELSHRFAPIDIREQMALNDEQTMQALADLKKITQKFLLLLPVIAYPYMLLEKIIMV